MNHPFICDNCGNEETIESPENGHALKILCDCGDKMVLNYTDNYEEVFESHICYTCQHYHDGNGDKCNYCNRI